MFSSAVFIEHKKQQPQHSNTARIEETLYNCCCKPGSKAMFPESHKLKLYRLQCTKLWISGRLRCDRISHRLGFSSPGQFCILILLILGTLPSITSCSELDRSILPDLQGTITDGPHAYPEEEHCEWLIVGKYVSQLKLTDMTEKNENWSFVYSLSIGPFILVRYYVLYSEKSVNPPSDTRPFFGPDLSPSPASKDKPHVTKCRETIANK